MLAGRANRPPGPISAPGDGRLLLDNWRSASRRALFRKTGLSFIIAALRSRKKKAEGGRRKAEKGPVAIPSPESPSPQSPTPLPSPDTPTTRLVPACDRWAREFFAPSSTKEIRPLVAHLRRTAESFFLGGPVTCGIRPAPLVRLFVASEGGQPFGKGCPAGLTRQRSSGAQNDLAESGERKAESGKRKAESGTLIILPLSPFSSSYTDSNFAGEETRFPSRTYVKKTGLCAVPNQWVVHEKMPQVPARKLFDRVMLTRGRPGAAAKCILWQSILGAVGLAPLDPPYRSDR